MTRPWLLLVVVAAPACTLDWGIGSDPYAGIADDPCQPGNLRETGEACVVPTWGVKIDGETKEWTSVPALATPNGCASGTCEPALVVDRVQLARIPTLAPDVRFEFRVQLAAPPLTTDPDVSYVVQLASTYQRWRDDLDALVASATGVRYQRNGIYIEPPSNFTHGYNFAFTADGFEGTINSDYVPFPDGANITFYTMRAGQTVYTPAPILACWTANDVASDPCSGVGP